MTETETLIKEKVRNKSRIYLRPLKIPENYNYNPNQDGRLKRNTSSTTKKIIGDKNTLTLSTATPRLNIFRMTSKRKLKEKNVIKNNLPPLKVTSTSKIIKNNENEDDKEINLSSNKTKEVINKIDKVRQIKEKEKFNKLKKLMFKRQNYMRIKQKRFNEESEEKNNNEKINIFLEDMCVYGNIMKKEIEENLSKNQDKYIKIEEALKMKYKDPNLFCLGLIANNLNSIGIKAVIENSEIEDKEEITGYEDILEEEKEEEALTSLQFIVSGYLYKTKYILHFDFGEKENEELLNNIEKYNEFKKILKKKLSKDYDTPTDKIIVTYPQRGSFEVQVIFQSEEFNNLDLDSFCDKFKNEKEFEILKNLKIIHSDLIMSACKLTKKAFDPLGNRIEGWGVGEKRGSKKYYPPVGWTGIGLKVLDKYENNTWIGMDNRAGEWCVAYHGAANGKPPDKVKKVLGLIYNGGLKPGIGQAHENCPDFYHKGKKVGKGVYCSPKIKTAQEFAGKCKINGKEYYAVFMLRVMPNKIRFCDQCEDSRKPNFYWVLNGTPDEIRPYRILFKCTNDNEEN